MTKRSRVTAKKSPRKGVSSALFIRNASCCITAKKPPRKGVSTRLFIRNKQVCRECKKPIEGAVHRHHFAELVRNWFRGGHWNFYYSNYCHDCAPSGTYTASECCNCGHQIEHAIDAETATPLLRARMLASVVRDSCCDRACRKQSEKIVQQNVACACCCEQFTPIRSDSQYCSDACRQRAYRERRREGAV